MDIDAAEEDGVRVDREKEIDELKKKYEELRAMQNNMGLLNSQSSLGPNDLLSSQMQSSITLKSRDAELEQHLGLSRISVPSQQVPDRRQHEPQAKHKALEGTKTSTLHSNDDEPTSIYWQESEA